eukprot:5648361-Ditylum_brightwellii.AAC.1
MSSKVTLGFQVCLQLKPFVRRGGAYICIVKTAHSLYPKKELEDAMKTFPGCTHLAMESSNDDGSK